MPYPNEHACRLRSPSAFQKDSFRRITQGNLSIIIGKLKGSTKTTAQAYRYPKAKWTAAAARAHCKKHNGKFEPASEAAENKPFEFIVTEVKNMHSDFKKIFDMFKAHYGNKEGKAKFNKWVKQRELDTSKPYSQKQLQKESYEWAKPLIKFLKEDKTGKIYKVDAHFAVNSMNMNIYTPDEVMQAVHSLPGKHIDLNHNLEWIIDGATILAANWEDHTVETLVHVKNGTKDAKERDVQQAIADKIIDHVSIEAGSKIVTTDPEGNRTPIGLEYNGLAFLDQDALPGIPLTRIMTCESLQESIFEELEQTTKKEVKESMEEKSRNDAQRAMSHFNITPAAWAKLSDAEKQAYIAKLPARGSGGNEAFGDASFPDSCFAYVPDSAKGAKGKKSDRKLPYKNKDGSVSLSHVRNALARLNQTQAISAAEKTRIKKMLQNILKKDNPDYKPTEEIAEMSLADIKKKIAALSKKLTTLDTKIYGVYPKADTTPRLSNADTIKIRAEMDIVRAELDAYRQALVQKTLALATSEVKANYCAMCGTKLVKNACPNEKCSVYGKKVIVDDEKIELRKKVADVTEELSTLTQEHTALKTENSKNENKVIDLAKKLAVVTRENIKIGIGDKQIETLKEALLTTKSEVSTLRGKCEGYTEQIAKLEKQVNTEHREFLNVEEKLGKKDAENEGLRRDLNEESTKRAASEQKALNEVKECSRLKLENAELLEEKATETRKISDLSTKLGESAKTKVALERDNATKLRKAATERLVLETEITSLKDDITNLKEDISKRDNIIIDKDTTVKKAIKEQKRLYNTLKANGIYEVNSDGTLKL